MLNKCNCKCICDMSYFYEAHKTRMNDYENFKKQYVKYQQDPYLFFVEVLEEVVNEDQKAFLDAIKDNHLLIGNVPRGIGTSFFICNIALWFYTCFDGARIVLITPPPEANINFLYSKFETLISKHKDLFIHSNTSLTKKVENTAESFSSIDFRRIPPTASFHDLQVMFSGFRAKNLMFLVDDADAIPEVVLNTIEIYHYDFVKIQYFYNDINKDNHIKKKEKNNTTIKFSPFNHLNVITGEDIIPGCITQDSVIERIKNYSREAINGEKPDLVLPDYIAKKMELENKDRIIIDNRINFTL